MDRVRVIRIVEYDGDRDWVEKTVAKSIQGTKVIEGTRNMTIRAVTLGTYPEIMKEKKDGAVAKESTDGK